MYSTIMVPVDLAHVDQLGKALQTAADLAKHYGAPITYLGATTPEPNEMAHTPQEFEKKLSKFAEEQGKGNGIETKSKVVIAHDPTVDLVNVLIDAIDSTGADLVVMASHQPGMAEHVFASHAGYVASHSHTSVMVVR